MKHKIKYWNNEITISEDIILRYFFPEGDKKTIKELKERSKYSYERVNTALKSLKKKKIVAEKKIGKTLVYYPDLNNLNLRRAFNHYMIERLINFGNKYIKIYNALQELKKEPATIILIFGSYSKGTETKTSDIDLLCTSFKKKEIEKAIGSLKHKYGLRFNPIVIPRTEFIKIKKDNSELWEDLKNNALVFYGQDWFYSLIY